MADPADDLSRTEREGAEIAMAEDQSNPDQTAGRFKAWRGRPSIGTLVREMRQIPFIRIESDARWNDESRLPDDISVNLGGVTLAECFTPSTVSNLYAELEKWPRRFGDEGGWTAQLDRGRSGTGMRWMTLGLVRRPGEFIIGDGVRDPALPGSVSAAWLNLTFLVPSVAIVCATFTFEESEADLSPLLRADYASGIEGIHATVNGHLGMVRSRIPWGRPKDFYISPSSSWDALGAKRHAVQELLDRREEECARWFYRRFKGRFSTTGIAERPAVRLLFTTTALPFQGHGGWRAQAGLDWQPNVYRSTQPAGWAYCHPRWGRTERRHVDTFAARRSDVGDNDQVDLRGTSNWSLTQRFQMEQSDLVARLALRALLEVYSARLAKLRDEAGRIKRPGRPVGDARRLDRYLITDGLDAATIGPDLAELTDDQMVFGFDVPQYFEDQEGFPDSLKDKRGPIALVASLCDELRHHALRLVEDISNTDANIRASAQLRQAISNTRLQRTVAIGTLAALGVALGALFG